MGTGVNVWTYAIPAVALLAVAAYFLYGAADRVGLPTEDREALVTEKSFAAGSTTYYTNVVGGRTITQSSQNPDAYMVGLDIAGMKTGGLVTKELYESLKPGDRVLVQVSRTRFSDKVLVTDIRR
jgi:hypothetical protein